MKPFLSKMVVCEEAITLITFGLTDVQNKSW